MNPILWAIENVFTPIFRGADPEDTFEEVFSTSTHNEGGA